MEKNKIKKSAAVFATTLIIIIVGVASFAYFGTFDVNLINNVAININAVSPGNASFVSSATQLNLQVPAANMSQTNAGSVAAENNAILTVNLTGAKDLLTTCTYDIVYEYDENSNVYGYGETPVTIENKIDIGLAILDGTDEENIQPTTNGINYYSNGRAFNYFSGSNPTGDYDENDKWDSIRKRVLVRNASISSIGELVTQKWFVDMAYLNLPISQEQLAGKAFTGKIYVENYDCGTIDLGTYGYEKILAYNGGKNEIEAKGTPDFSEIADTNEGMYAAKDDLGMSYYFRGAVNNNWVKFGKYTSEDIRYRGYYSTTDTSYEDYTTMDECTSAPSYNVNCEEIKLASIGDDIYWRIIRINGDGSIRMIYSGAIEPTFETSVVLTGDSTQIGKSTFDYNVGYMYTDNEQHGNSTSSTIKTFLENWFTNTTLKDDLSVSKNQIFCNDRSVPEGNWSASGNTYYYGAYNRINDQKPIFTCPTESDKFTTITSNIGNQLLNYPIGLITSEEIMMAGGSTNYDNLNTFYYLYTGQDYWSGSPAEQLGFPDYPMVYVECTGNLSYRRSFDDFAVRPVISLSNGVKLSGSGTYNDPYKVVS